MPICCDWKLCISIFVIATACTSLAGQSNPDDFPELRLRTARTVTIDDGLPTECFYQVLLDSKGRAWMAPCNDEQVNRDLHLFQFDGYRSILHELDYPPNTRVVLCMTEGDSVVIGTEISGHSAWRLNVHTGVVNKFNVPSDSGFVVSIHQVSNEFYAIVSYGTNIGFYQLQEDSLVYRASVPGHLRYALRPSFTHNVMKESLVHNGKLYAVDHKSTFCEFDPATGEVQSVLLDSASQDNMKSMFKWNGQVHVAGHTGQILRVVNGQVEEVDLLPDGWNYQVGKLGLSHVPSVDESGNLLLSCIDKEGEKRSLLIDRAGKHWDFTPISRRYPASRFSSYFGQDFKRNFQHRGGDSLTFIDIVPDYGFASIPCRSARAIVGLLGDTLLTKCSGLIFIDMGQMSSVDIDDKELTSLFQWGAEAITIDNHGRVWNCLPNRVSIVDPTSKEELIFPVVRPLRVANFDDSVLIVSKTHFLLCSGSETITCDTILTLREEDVIGSINAIAVRDQEVWIGASRGLWRFNMESSQLEEVAPSSVKNLHVMSILATAKHIVLGTESIGSGFV